MADLTSSSGISQVWTAPLLEMSHVPGRQVMPRAVLVGDEHLAPQDGDDLVGTVGPAEGRRRRSPQEDQRAVILDARDLDGVGHRMARQDPVHPDWRGLELHRPSRDRGAGAGPAALVEGELLVGSRVETDSEAAARNVLTACSGVRQVIPAPGPAVSARDFTSR